MPRTPRIPLEHKGDLHTGTRKCTSCWVWKSIELFHWKDQKTRRARICKACHALESAQRAKSPEARERRRRYESSPEFKAKRLVKNRTPEQKARQAEYQRNYRKKKLYGLSETQVDDLRSEQGYACLLCYAVTDLVVDHCHKSGKVRGLLCRTCNAGLGMLKESPAVIGRALDYLLRHE